ncbi:phosphoenolpyruvate-protein phosphotransferase [Treponema socranskii subsp. socranskii VPI DR56BR1116 = ATCC 35536]|uniref:Phosphoenolpyruvate-protein phosphotransferase n=1 Tax=Treponema socranskii subsp. socranskii VPI DR56BR1116 = ATCC 35536 TaxID=1125725 RepID=U1FMW0_TRESO|nr:phosphoenolpyruvate--protein phosphotransferase [Treponema socranskii]ERF61173.1 phosphoenolpyruvate-protein phosphotransferase [Treponema socranskii subsp. socranskii VPI DR56BR1116 = ATCC 35536]ERJ99995.1 phosphoenolpyruvate-protein phosphotransferase [Treponema socranskii subsp. socranskii VPI DR56BR1116 = ATCC 35536]
MYKELHGTVLSDGLCIARIVKSAHRKKRDTEKKIDADAIDSECAQFQNVKNTVRQKLEAFMRKADADSDKAQADILKSYIAILDDPELENDVVEKIKNDFDTLQAALARTADEYVEAMGALEDEYLRARADDFNELFSMLLFCTDPETAQAPRLTEPSVLAAYAVTPVDMAELDKTLLLGILCETGNRTSHAAIIARANGIPMLSNIPYDTAENGDTVIIDGEALFVNPPDEKIRSYEKKYAEVQAEKRLLQTLAEKRAVTLDGTVIELEANIGSEAEAEKALQERADGIGLFRTEFILNENPDRIPSEERQYEIYAAVLKAMHGKPVTIRTFDIGGDKQYPCLAMPKEENPFLGWRGIRFCLDNKDFFYTQLRALFRSSTEGKLHIMFPMITEEEEVRRVCAIVSEIKSDLDARHIPYGKDVQIGIMIETPAAALIAERLAPLVDFFSIGSNDLTQYTLAADRGNDKISALYRESHPAVLRLIQNVIEAAKKYGKHVSVCGEMAGDVSFTKKLLDMGLRCFSMSPANIQKVKRAILSATIEAYTEE